MIPLSRCLTRFRSVRLRNYVNPAYLQDRIEHRTEDEILLRTKDFRGVAPRHIRNSKNITPDIHLAHIKHTLKSSGRVSSSSFFNNVLKEIENNNGVLLSILTKFSEQWVPMLLISCGNSMSNTHRSTREIILDRLWNAFLYHKIPISISSYNNRLRSMLDNKMSFSVDEELSVLTEKLNLTANQETFQLLLERFSHLGDIDACRNLVYEMAKNGCIVDSKCNQSLVYCFALRGHDAKADSLVEQSKSKYNEEARNLANGACAKAAAFRGNTARLRQILRRSVNKEKKLTISSDDLFETIWLLSENGDRLNEQKNIVIIEQILNAMPHSKGFFHLLVREIERHISHDHFYSAICLLEDVKRVSDCLKNQQRSKIMEQLLSRLSHQLIRNQVPISQVLDIAHRIVALFKKEPVGSRFHDNLLHAALMYKDLTIDQRIDYLTALVDVVDHSRERPHIILPLIVLSPDVMERLKVIFRCHILGYKDISSLGNELINLILQPIFDYSLAARRETKMQKSHKILKSFKIPDNVIWNLFHIWYKQRVDEESKLPVEQLQAPTANELKIWLREQYSPIFEQDKINNSSVNRIMPTYDRLKAIIIDERDAAKAVTFLNRCGWPDDTNYAEIGSQLVDLVLDLEDWPTVTKTLSSLSSQSESWTKTHGENFSPLKNNHLLSILRRLVQEEGEFSIRRLIEFSYELKGMFPNAVVSYDTFFDTLYEYNRLFHKIFEKLTELDVPKVDESMELLRTLIKLDILSLHANETLTTVFVNNVIKKIGLEEGVNTWMKFQSSLSCSNAIVALIRHCLSRNDDLSTKRVQYILHKAQNFTSQSRVHTLYCAVLLSSRKYEEAVKYIIQHKNNINPNDCISSFKLMNALKFKRLDEEFVYNFIDLFLTHSSIISDCSTIKSLQVECIRICQLHDAGPLSLKIYQRFLKAGLDLEDDEKKKLWEVVGKHDEFARKWLYLPDGMLRLGENDPINQERDTFEIHSKLRADIESMSSSDSKKEIIS